MTESDAVMPSPRLRNYRAYENGRPTPEQRRTLFGGHPDFLRQVAELAIQKQLITRAEAMPEKSAVNRV